ncbi:MAG: hypothetical protein NZ898_07020 [Myxococcota bacterium]|nr:hypothetical protein [Myxococcota bacterium]MDW8361893.1 hypothetical protein [Myxococcales bacterium]
MHRSARIWLATLAVAALLLGEPGSAVAFASPSEGAGREQRNGSGGRRSDGVTHGVAGVVHRALIAAVIETVQARSCPHTWGFERVSERRWRARRDSSAFVVGAGGIEWRRVPAAHGEPTPMLRLRTIAWGRAGRMGRVPTRAIDVEAQTAWFEAHRGLRERWVHGPFGLEQLFVLDRRPPGRGPLRIRTAVGGTLRATSRGERHVEFCDAAGTVHARWVHPFVRDARGRPLDVVFHLRRDGFELDLVIDDTKAVYPLHVDPLLVVEDGSLQADDASRDDGFGLAIALSADGAVALVGAPRHSTPGLGPTGAAYVFRRTATGWDGPEELRPAVMYPAAGFGRSVALSADGQLAVVGAPGISGGSTAEAYAGYVYTFRRTSAGWTRETPLEAGDPPSLQFGHSIALTPDGRILVVGAPAAHSGEPWCGKVQVFERSTEGWSRRASFDGSLVGVCGRFGYAVAVSHDAGWVFVGAPFALESRGVVAAWRREADTWRALGPIASGSDGRQYLGIALAAAAEGTPLVVGSVAADEVAVLDWTGSAWERQADIVAHDGSSGDRFGEAVAVSADGGRLFVGAPGLSSSTRRETGAVYPFVRQAGMWQPLPPLRSASSIDGAQLGSALGLSSGGDFGLAGAPCGYADSASRACDQGRVYGFRLVRTDGEPCTARTDCASGFCVDGVCCNEACGGGASDDCQACSVAAGARTDGVCAPRPASHVCRPARASCDVAESCDGTNADCPPDRNTCEPQDDAGSGLGDGSVGDAGARARPVSGCACRLVRPALRGTTMPASPALFLAGLLVLCRVRLERRGRGVRAPR